jgi:hypothetical protein
MERPELTEVAQDTFGTSSLLILLSILVRCGPRVLRARGSSRTRIQSAIDNISTAMAPGTTDLRMS